MPSSQRRALAKYGCPSCFVLGADRRAERLLVRRAPRATLRFDRIAADRREHDGRLLAAHHRDARIGPHPQEARAEGTSAHAVVAGAVAAADDHRELRHLRARHGGDQLGAVAGDAARFVLLSDHEARDVLQEHERNLPLRAQLDEVRTLQRRFRKQDAVVGDDADRIAPDAGEAGDERRAVARLELVELAAVDDARDHLAHVVGLLDVGADDAVDLLRGRTAAEPPRAHRPRPAFRD